MLSEEVDILEEATAGEVVEEICEDVNVLEEVSDSEVLEMLCSKVDVLVALACKELNIYFFFNRVHLG